MSGRGAAALKQSRPSTLGRFVGSLTQMLWLWVCYLVSSVMYMGKQQYRSVSLLVFVNILVFHTIEEVRESGYCATVNLSTLRSAF